MPQLALFLEVHAVTLIAALNEHAPEAEEKLEVVFGRRERKRMIVKSRDSWPTFK